MPREKTHGDAPSFHRDAQRRLKTPKVRPRCPMTSQVFIETHKDALRLGVFNDAPRRPCFHSDEQRRPKILK